MIHWIDSSKIKMFFQVSWWLIIPQMVTINHSQTVPPRQNWSWRNFSLAAGRFGLGQPAEGRGQLGILGVPGVPWICICRGLPVPPPATPPRHAWRSQSGTLADPTIQSDGAMMYL